MKELTIQIKVMPKEDLEKYNDDHNFNWVSGKLSKAYQVSLDDFKTYYRVSPYHRIGEIIEMIMKNEGEL